MLTITSLQNERIKTLKTLRTKKGRRETGTYLIEGRRAVLDALSHGVEFLCVLVSDESLLPNDPGCPVYLVTAQILEALSETESCDGILAQAKIRRLFFDEAAPAEGLIVLADHLQDAGNLGTIIRTADAAGACAVLLSEECVELYNPKAIRATMGSVFNIPVYECCAIQALMLLKQRGYTVYAAALDGTDAYQTEPAEKSCLVIGNEGNGITASVMEVCDRVVTLPMRGKAESLNAAVAAGILIYHFTFGK